MELLTAAQIAKELNLPESTVRYYRDRFTDYIPMTGEGRNRRYRPEAMDVFAFIAERMRNNMPADVLERELRARFPVEITVEPQRPQADSSSNAAAIVAVPAFLEVMARFGQALEDVAELPAVVEAQSREIAGLREQVAELTTAVTAAAAQQQTSEARDRELLASVAELRKALEPERPQAPWWKRLLGLEPA